MENINKLIEKDKNRYNNFYNRQIIKNNISNLNDENHNNNNNNINNIANDEIDNMIIDKKSYCIENNEFSPIISSKNEQQSGNENKQNQFGKYSYRKDNNINFECSNCSHYICCKNDMKYLEESYSNSIIMQFGKNNSSSKRLIKINNNHNSIENGILSFDNYKYKFEITPFTNIYHPLKIEVGFKMEDINNKDLNLINYEDSVNYNVFNCKIASLYDSFELKKI